MQSIIGKIIKIIATGCHILRLKCRKVDSLRLSVCLLGGVWHIVKEVGVLLGSRGVYCRPGETAPAFGEVRCGAALCGVQSVSCPVVLITFLLSLCLSLALSAFSLDLTWFSRSFASRASRPVASRRLAIKRAPLLPRRRPPPPPPTRPIHSGWPSRGRTGPGRALTPAGLPARPPLFPASAPPGRLRRLPLPGAHGALYKCGGSENRIFRIENFYSPHVCRKKNNK